MKCDLHGLVDGQKRIDVAEKGEIHVQMTSNGVVRESVTTGLMDCAEGTESDELNGVYADKNPQQQIAVADGSVNSGPASLGPEYAAVPPEGDNEVTDVLLHKASLIADRNMKLAVFCTRPAVYMPVANLLTETISTFFLVIGILFIKERSKFLYDGYEDVYRHGIMSFYMGLLIFVLVLCLGGMGVAMNPARDLAARFAHWILPIEGKGPSEWRYAWIPVVGPFMGAIVAAYTFLGLKELNKGMKDGGGYDEEFEQLFSLLRST